MQKNFGLMGLFRVLLVEVTLSEENDHLEKSAYSVHKYWTWGQKTITQFSLMKIYLTLFGKLLRTLRVKGFVVVLTYSVYRRNYWS